MLATLGVIRGRRLSAIEPFARLLRLTTLLSGTLTILCAVGIFAVEVYSWMQNGAWEPYRLSSAIDLIRPDHDITYATASAPRSAPPPTSGHALIDWLLDVPVELSPNFGDGRGQAAAA